MYKVFFNERTVFINTNVDHLATSNSNYTVVSNQNDAHLAWLKFKHDSSKSNLYLTGTSAEIVLQLFMQNFKVVEAAGGLVYNNEGKLLCIYRWNKWDLPKGKIEKNETIEEAAVREVEEETGISGVKIVRYKATTYHIFQSPNVDGNMILKPTHWFIMSCSGNQTTIPQVKEDIVKAEWMNQQQMEMVKQNTYASLKEVIEL